MSFNRNLLWFSMFVPPKNDKTFSVILSMGNNCKSKCFSRGWGAGRGTRQNFRLRSSQRQNLFKTFLSSFSFRRGRHAVRRRMIKKIFKYCTQILICVGGKLSISQFKFFTMTKFLALMLLCILINAGWRWKVSPSDSLWKFCVFL